MEQERAVILAGQPFPASQCVGQGWVSLSLQLSVVEELGGELQESRMGAIVIHKLGDLSSKGIKSITDTQVMGLQ